MNAGVSGLLDKTLLIFSCQKLWISQKGKLEAQGCILCVLWKRLLLSCDAARQLICEELQVQRSVVAVMDDFLYCACSHAT